MKTKPRIFVSVPDDRHLDGRRKRLKKAIIRFIAGQDYRMVGFEPEQFGAGLSKNLVDWTVDRADKLIRRCDGAVVLVLARNHARVVDLGGKQKRQDRSALALPSSYNHLEGALALAQQLPVFILFEEDMDRNRDLQLRDQAGHDSRGSGRKLDQITNIPNAFRKLGCGGPRSERCFPGVLQSSK